MALGESSKDLKEFKGIKNGNRLMVTVMVVVTVMTVCSFRELC